MPSTYLTRTFQSGGNRKKWTMSYWLKRDVLGSSNIMFQTYVSTYTWCRFDTNNKFQFQDGNGGNKVTTRVFRDTNAWYHFVVALDTDNSTAGDRYKIYVNGERITAFDTSSDPSSGYEGEWNKAQASNIGRHSNNSTFFNGLMSHIHFCDGYAYAASDFGETDSTTGEWKIKPIPSVSYGTTGFFILKDGNSVTDQSGNSNNWTANGNLTKTEDCPSNIFATFNPLSPSGSSYSNGNNNCTTISGTYASRPTTSTLGMSSGKYYAEIKVLAPNTGNPDYSKIGITGRPLEHVTGSEQYQHLGSKTYDYAYNSYNGNVMTNTGSSNNGTAYGNTYTTNDIIGIAVDLDNNKLYFSKNGTWQNSGDPTSGSTGTGAVSIAAASSTTLGAYLFGVDAYHYTPQYNFSANFGNGYFGTTAVSSAGTNASNIGIFEYDVPTGYTALSTKGLNSF